MFGTYPRDFIDETSFSTWSKKFLDIYNGCVEHRFSSPEQVLNFCTKFYYLVDGGYIEFPETDVKDKLTQFGLRKIPECLYQGSLENPSWRGEELPGQFYNAFNALAQKLSDDATCTKVQNKIIDCLKGHHGNDTVNGMSYIENIACNTFNPVLTQSFLNNFAKETRRNPVSLRVSGKFLFHRADKIVCTASLSVEKPFYENIKSLLEESQKSEPKGLMFAELNRVIRICDESIGQFKTADDRAG